MLDNTGPLHQCCAQYYRGKSTAVRSRRKKATVLNDVMRAVWLVWYEKIAITLVEEASEGEGGSRLANPYLIDLCDAIERHDRESNGAQLQRVQIPASSCMANGSWRRNEERAWMTIVIRSHGILADVCGEMAIARVECESVTITSVFLCKWFLVAIYSNKWYKIGRVSTGYCWERIVTQ